MVGAVLDELNLSEKERGGLGGNSRLEKATIMLLEMALAEFPYELDRIMTTGSSGESPVDSHLCHSRRRGSSLEERSYSLPSSSSSFQVSADVEEEQLRSQDLVSNRNATPIRCLSEQYYCEEASVSFEWEASPGKPMMVQELRSSGRSSHPESLLLPPALRPAAVGSGRSVRNNVASPSTSGIGGRVKSILGGKGSRTVKEGSASPERVASDSPGRGREDVDRASLDSSDDGEAASPVSTLDLPMSPLTPSYSPQQRHEIVRRQGSILDQARPTNYWTNTLMAEELPAVIEEDEEDLESVYGYHTMEFQALDSPSTSGDRRDWTLSGRENSPRSLSAPNSRQHSSLRPAAANRGRRRSDFDWPEDFEERPEEVVKEVDETLWAFSPVASTFVFSGNDTVDSAKRSLGPTGTGTHTPCGSSPGLGSVLEHLSFRKSLVKPASSKPNYGLTPSYEAEYSSQRSSSRLRHHSVNGDDDYVSNRGKQRSYSCLPFLSLCSPQRPTAISFSQRLGPTLSNLHN